MLKVIRLIVVSTQWHNLEQSWLISDETAKPYLSAFIKALQNSKKQYFGDDLSENSDSEEEEAYLKQVSSSDNSINKKTGMSLKNLKRQTTQFWLKTKMHTPRDAGLKKKITTISAQIKKGINKETQLNKLKGLVEKTLNNNLKERGKIEYNQSENKEAESVIEKFNLCQIEKQTELLHESKPIFILGTRGINYMLDRWNANARRYHRKIDEYQQPQYSEAVLKTLPYDYYTDLDLTHDFHRDEKEEFSLQKEALRLNSFLQSLSDSGPCLANSANHNGSYLFNSVNDCLQDHFSNGVDRHLDDFATKRLSYPHYWGTHLKNSFNPGIAIGSRPYHALKYTFGLKDYYPRSMLPRYWNDGTIEYSHVGKVYLSLHPLEEILSQNGPNNLSVQDRQGRVSIGDQISPEKELSFLGFMPGDRIFHHFVAKFPSFRGPWKNIYQLKYGLDKETYEAFQHLISITLPETKERNRIINLLAEWLCSYHEVLLIEIAKEEALRRGGILAYLNRDGKLTLEPENGRIFTRGELNTELSNEVHIMRELRLKLEQYLGNKKDITTIPGFDLFAFNDALEALKRLLKNDEFLKTIASKVKFTTEEEALIFNKQYSYEQIKTAKARNVISNLIKHGLYAKTTFVSYKKQINYLANQNHLYTDFEINTLLYQAFDNLNVNVYAAQHPLVQGRLGESCRRLFIDGLKRIFQQNKTAVMPIETSQDELNEEAYFNINGIHWNGLVISVMGDNQFRIELIDPSNSPEKDINLTESSNNEIAEYREQLANLLSLIKQAAEESNVTIQVHWLATQQQAGDLDCGAWTVDNLVRRAQNLPLRKNTDITGNQLRQLHDNQYVYRLTN